MRRDIQIMPFSRKTDRWYHSPIIAEQLIDMTTGDAIVSFPHSLNAKDGVCTATLRAYAHLDMLLGNPVDPYIAAELARIENKGS